ncbi:MAG: SOS response-associated peptidase family protein [Saonia sp.]
MYYKLSNTADRSQIEEAFDMPFKHPKIFRPEVVIHGLNEATIPVITMEEPELISFAIWGMLPSNYEEEWAIFQSVTNTLNLEEKSLDANYWHSESLNDRRCLVIVTGFFTSYLHQGKVYPYYISLSSGEPFLLAGIYNRAEDGFLTCSILVGKADSFIQRFQSIVDSMPLIISRELMNAWLNPKADIGEIKELLRTLEKADLQANPIAKELFNQNISYDSILEPVDYKNIPPQMEQE